MDTNHYKERLEGELANVTSELKSVGRINPDNKADWEALPENMDIDNADPNVVADKFEEFEENTAVLKQLEMRYNELKEALARIDRGEYGKCAVCGKDIEHDRLDANPAAPTCKEHMQ